MIGWNGLRTLVLIVLMTSLLLVVGQLVGGLTGLIVAAVFAVAMNFFSYWYSDKLILKTMHVRAVSPADAPALHRVVERAARDAGLPKPKVYLVATPVPNAFATGRNPNNTAPTRPAPATPATPKRWPPPSPSCNWPLSSPACSTPPARWPAWRPPTTSSSSTPWPAVPAAGSPTIPP